MSDSYWIKVQYNPNVYTYSDSETESETEELEDISYCPYYYDATEEEISLKLTKACDYCCKHQVLINKICNNY